MEFTPKCIDTEILEEYNRIDSELFMEPLLHEKYYSAVYMCSSDEAMSAFAKFILLGMSNLPYYLL